MVSKSYTKVYPFHIDGDDNVDCVESQSPPTTPTTIASEITTNTFTSTITAQLPIIAESNTIGFEPDIELDAPVRSSVKLNKGSLKITTSSKKVALEVQRKGTVLSSFPILFNNIMGAGILGLPYAVANTGFVLGPILMLVAGGSALFALHLLSRCSLKMMEFEPAPTFYSVAMQASPRFATMVDIALIIKCFGVATSYQIVIGGLMPDVMAGLGAPAAMQTRQIWIAIASVIIIPLSFMNSLDGLKHTSKASMAFVFFLMFMMIFYACNIPGMDPCSDLKYEGPCKGSVGSFVVQTNTLKVFSIFIFAFNCHQNVFGIVNELREPNIKKMNAITFLAVGAALIVVLTIACVGYSTYGSNVESNVLRNYPSKLNRVITLSAD